MFTFASNILTVESSESVKISTYYLKLKVKYAENTEPLIYSYAGSLSFTVNVIASCKTALLTIDDSKFKADYLGFTMT